MCIRDSPEELTLQTPQGFWNRFRVDVRVRHEATAIDPAGKQVTVKNLETGEVTVEGYDKLLLAPGAAPTRPPLPGLDSPRLFSLRTVEDTFRIRSFVERTRPKTAVLAGGGFISLEMEMCIRDRQETGRRVEGKASDGGERGDDSTGEGQLPQFLISNHVRLPAGSLCRGRSK